MKPQVKLSCFICHTNNNVSPRGNSELCEPCYKKYYLDMGIETPKIIKYEPIEPKTKSKKRKKTKPAKTATKKQPNLVDQLIADELKVAIDNTNKSFWLRSPCPDWKTFDDIPVICLKNILTGLAIIVLTPFVIMFTPKGYLDRYKDYKKNNLKKT